jgi:hypothetical protein
MKDITGVEKRENGIVVEFREGPGYKIEPFTYAELIDLRINALDLLEHPQNYALDREARKIVERMP